MLTMCSAQCQRLLVKYLPFFEHFLCAKQGVKCYRNIPSTYSMLRRACLRQTLHILSQPCGSHNMVLCFSHKETTAQSG